MNSLFTIDNIPLNYDTEKVTVVLKNDLAIFLNMENQIIDMIFEKENKDILPIALERIKYYKKGYIFHTSISKKKLKKIKNYKLQSYKECPYENKIFSKSKKFYFKFTKRKKEIINNNNYIAKPKQCEANTTKKTKVNIIKKHIKHETYQFTNERQLTFNDINRQLKQIYLNKNSYQQEECCTNYIPNIFATKKIMLFFKNNKINYITTNLEDFENQIKKYKYFNIIYNDILFENIIKPYSNQISTYHFLKDKEQIFYLLCENILKIININSFQEHNTISFNEIINNMINIIQYKENIINETKDNILFQGLKMSRIHTEEPVAYIIFSDASLKKEKSEIGCAYITYGIDKYNNIFICHYGICYANYKNIKQEITTNTAEQIAFEFSIPDNEKIPRTHYIDNMFVVNQNQNCFHVKTKDFHNKNGSNILVDLLARNANKPMPEIIKILTNKSNDINYKNIETVSTLLSI